MALLVREAPYVVGIAGQTIILVPGIIRSLDHAETAACLVFAYLNMVLCVLATRRVFLSQPGSVAERRARIAVILHLMAATLAWASTEPILILSWPVAAVGLGWLYKKGAFEDQ